MSEILPSKLNRVFAVWRRHQKVYFKHLAANAMPPLMEPLFFLLALGFGIGKYVPKMGDLSFVEFLAPAMMATSSFYTASFETTYGTFIRMEHQKTYYNMLATPLTFNDLYFGELLWCGFKGFLFSWCVLLVISVFGLVSYPWVLVTPFIGFLNAVAFGIIGFFITGFTKNINNFNLYFTGILTPIFFFSGTIFPLHELPSLFQKIAYFVPLTHSVILMRQFSSGQIHASLITHILFLLVLPVPFLYVSYYKLKKRLIY